jgi:hypothetical protein
MHGARSRTLDTPKTNVALRERIEAIHQASRGDYAVWLAAPTRAATVASGKNGQVAVRSAVG